MATFRIAPIVTDLNKSLVALPPQIDTETQKIKDFRNSQISGSQRQQNLNEFCENNEWLKPFYAEYTFEVDFIMAGNSYEIIQTIAKSLKKPAVIEKISEKLNDEDISVSGEEVLRLANKYGKGWFAIMVANNIDHLTIMPDYLVRAIAFAAKHISKEVFLFMAKYRLASLIKSTTKGDETDYNSFLIQLSQLPDCDDALKYFTDNFKEDQLTKLISYTK